MPSDSTMEEQYVNKKRIQLSDTIVFISILVTSYMYSKYCNLKSDISQEADFLNITNRSISDFLFLNKLQVPYTLFDFF